MVKRKKSKVKTKKTVAVKKIKATKKRNDYYGLGEAFMKMSNFLFGKGWNKT